MSQAMDRLRARREALLQRGEFARQDLRDHLKHIEAAVDGVDRGLSRVRQVVTPPVLVAGGVLATLLLGRGRTRRALAGGLALFGLFQRVRSTGQLLGKMAERQPVRRSR